MSKALDQAQQELLARSPALYRIVAEAVDSLYVDRQADLMRYSKRTRRTIVHDAMVTNARRYEAEELGVSIEQDGNLTTMVIDNTYRIRFKFHDPLLRTHNNPTQQSIRFQEQTAPVQLTFSFTPEPVTNLNLGYQMNLTDTAATGIWLTQPDGIANAWAWQLEPPAQDNVVPLPSTPPAPDSLRGGGRVRPKTAKKKQPGSDSRGDTGSAS
jgi:hypothetical protein